MAGRRNHRGAASTAGFVMVALALVAGTRSGPVGAAEVSTDAPYTYSFVSSPDFLNFDLGDTRVLASHGPGDPNSYNASYARALATVFEAFRAEGVRDVAVAGDLVNGHWGEDTGGTRIFGPTSTPLQRRRAIKAAARFYYRTWTQNFADYGLRPHAAIGDHEIGDDPWRGAGGFGTGADNAFKQSAVGLYKKLFSRYVLRDDRAAGPSRDHPDGPASATAYATMLDPEVELISLDVFEETSNDVRVRVDRQQLRWLRAELAEADANGVDWKVVQFHTPVIGPVRTRGSSGLMYPGGARSKLWKVLRRGQVDLVLNGEVHDITAHQPRAGDPVQISHGGLFQYGLTNWLTLKFDNDSLQITSKAFHRRLGRAKRLWQTDTHINGPAAVSLGTPYVAGTMTVDRAGTITERSGLLDVYRGSGR